MDIWVNFSFGTLMKNPAMSICVQVSKWTRACVSARQTQE